MSKILLLTGGGDWADASVDALVVPEGRDVNQDLMGHPGWRKGGPLRAWLIEQYGYREPTEDEVVMADDD